MRDYLTIADLVAMPQLGLQLVGGHEATANPVLWTHVSELSDPGPWLEGGELLIVNGFGIPQSPADQVEYVSRLAHHRLAGLVIGVKAPDITQEMLDEADRLRFPVLRIPRHVPFIDLSYLVANASEQSARGRLSRHLRIFETLRFRNGTESNTAEVYSQLEQVSGYRLALLTSAGRPLLSAWPWVPEDLDRQQLQGVAELQMIPGGYVLPLFVGSRATAYLVGKEHEDAAPGGLAALQHVGTLAALDAIDDQRRREVVHRHGSALLAVAIDGEVEKNELEARFSEVGLEVGAGLRFLAFGAASDGVGEIEVRDWLTDRGHPHLLRRRGTLFAVVGCDDGELRSLAADLGTHVGVSSRLTDLDDLPRMRRQALWSLGLAEEESDAAAMFAEDQLDLARWLNPDAETVKYLADGTLHPIKQHDEEYGTELLHTLSVYFQNQGSRRKAAAQLFVHEHTLTYRLRRIEQLTGRNLKNYRDAFELWLAVESRSLME